MADPVSLGTVIRVGSIVLGGLNRSGGSRAYAERVRRSTEEQRKRIDAALERGLPIGIANAIGSGFSESGARRIASGGFLVPRAAPPSGGPIVTGSGIATVNPSFASAPVARTPSNLLGLSRSLVEGGGLGGGAFGVVLQASRVTALRKAFEFATKVFRRTPRTNPRRDPREEDPLQRPDRRIDQRTREKLEEIVVKAQRRGEQAQIAGRTPSPAPQPPIPEIVSVPEQKPMQGPPQYKKRLGFLDFLKIAGLAVLAFRTAFPKQKSALSPALARQTRAQPQPQPSPNPFAPSAFQPIVLGSTTAVGRSTRLGLERQLNRARLLQPQMQPSREREEREKCEKKGKRNRVQCWEGFYKEYPNSTRFKKWRLVDCRTRRQIREF